MSRVEINGKVHKQEPGITLLSLRTSYPACWLESEGEDYRNHSHVLENGKSYVLKQPTGVGSRLRQVCMRDRIFGHAQSGGTDLSAALASELKYKIAVTQAKFVESHGDTFELGECEYGVAVDSLLEHILVGNVGESEITTVSRNADFLKIFDICCGYMVYRDQVDPSSIVRRRPDDTGVHRGYVCFKNAAKAHISEAEVARNDLTDKLSPDALRVFPANSQSIFGMTSFPHLINIYNIGFNSTSNKFHTTLLRSFDMRHLNERVRFIRAVFKIAEWISTVPGPHEQLFHLVPGVRTKTPNGHHVTWTKDCLLKELRLRGTAKTRAAFNEEQRIMDCTLLRIRDIYTARLPNVAWGSVELPNLLKVTRIGFMLHRAILAGKITREKALADVRKGVADLHALGHAHTDIKVANIFVDDGTAFLDDLEFVVSTTVPARREGRGLAEAAGQTAQEQDLAQLQLLAGDILRL